MSGYVRLYRSVYDNPVFADFTEQSVFVWMIARAAWQANEVRYKGRRITLERGQLSITTRDLAKKTKWSEAKARRFLKRLSGDAMVVVSSDAGLSVITLCNYDEYQKHRQSDDAPSDAAVYSEVTQTRRSGDAQNKEDKIIKTNNITLSTTRDKETKHGKRGTRIAKDWRPSADLARSISEREGFTAGQIQQECYEFEQFPFALSHASPHFSIIRLIKSLNFR